jgi:RNA polymerase sigma-70 factor (ECF subfamily)
VSTSRREVCLAFQTTSWGVLRQAAEGSSAASREALGRLCETYWPPVYGFIRSRGHSPSDAEDLTQAYFARFLEKGYLADFRPEVGRFRTFLRASVAHFLANEWDRVRALKRGGGQVVLSLDAATAEERLRLEPVDRLTPETVFERQWAAAVLSRCLERLRREQAAGAGEGRFERLKAFLSGDGADVGYSTLARELGLKEGAARSAVHRLRRRFAAVLREEILETVSDPREVDAEIRWLLEAVRRKE